MIKSVIAIFEPSIPMMIGTVFIATVLPARGIFIPVFGQAAAIGIVLLFFLHGAKLSRDAILVGARNWKLHLAVFAVTFGLFPLFGLGLAALPLLSGSIASGLIFLTLLPSTVQSSIAFTSVARGNVAAAVCSASFSNLIGIFLSPALVAITMHSANTRGGVSIESIRPIVVELLVPFVAGHFSRLWIGNFVTRHKALVTVVDRGSILLVVYTAFGAAVVGGLWHRVSPQSLGLIALACMILLALVLLMTWTLGRAMGLNREDAIVLLFCGSKKSLASGVPMAGVLFPVAQVGSIILPLMLFHQIQLIACAFLARRFAAEARR